jgi:hypothetical protein
MSIELPQQLTKLTQEEIERDRVVVESALFKELMSTIERKSVEQGGRAIVENKIRRKIDQLKANPRYIDYPTPKLCCLLFNDPINGNVNNDFDFPGLELQEFIEKEL